MSWEPPPDTKCCDTWEQSKEAGTDNEQHGAVTTHSGGEWLIGCKLPLVKFCPWCGAAKNHALLESERDALKARVEELEKERHNLNKKLDEQQYRYEKRVAALEPRAAKPEEQMPQERAEFFMKCRYCGCAVYSLNEYMAHQCTVQLPCSATYTTNITLASTGEADKSARGEK